MPAKLKIANIDDLISEYQAGASLKQLADGNGISDTALSAALRDKGVKLRTMSEAVKMNWSRNRDVCLQGISKMHAGNVGRVRSRESMIAAAKTRYNRLTAIHAGEVELLNKLQECGLGVIPQHPAGPYNIDLAITKSAIAVEVIWTHLAAKRRASHAKRLKYLLDNGWFVIFVRKVATENDRVTIRRERGRIAGCKSRALDFAAIAQCVHSCAKILRRNKSMRGKYLVIGSDGKPLAALREYFDGIPFVETLET